MIPIHGWEKDKTSLESNFSAHFPSTISKEIDNFVDNDVLLSSRYLFIQRRCNIQYGYCTHCKKDMVLKEKIKHKEYTNCPSCKSKCQARSSGMGRKFLYDKAYAVYYEKSLVNPQAIIARGFYVSRNYSGDYRKVVTNYSLEALYLFEPGNSEFYSNQYFSGSRYVKRKSVYSLTNTIHANIYCDYSLESICKAVKGTPFQYSTWEKYGDVDNVKFFNLASKYPCIEYLTKLGFTQIVNAKLYGTSTYGVINWRGKTIDKVLKLSKQELKSILDIAYIVDPYVLKLYQFSKKDGSNLSAEEVYKLSQKIKQFDQLKKLLTYTTLRKINNYIEKQYEIDQKSKKKHFYGQYQVAIHWRDYLSDCEKLGMDVTSESVLFPKNIYTAHQNTIKQIKHKANKELDKKIAKRINSLEKMYGFENKEFFIRPVKNTQELIDEGKALNHCVGTYAGRYANGA
ncbi:PcfJ domain-containing protein, partial [Micromonospora provocatoris]